MYQQTDNLCAARIAYAAAAERTHVAHCYSSRNLMGGVRLR